MKRWMVRWCLTLLCCIVTAMLMSAVIFAQKSNEPAVVDSGTCGENLTWTLTDDGVLTISGTGEMYDMDTIDEIDGVPWSAYMDDIKSVVLEAGATSIGDCAFAQCVNLTAVGIPEGITRH